MNNEVTVKYNGSVKANAGWRSVEYTAVAEKISEKRVKIIKVQAIDNEPVTYGMSRTGAKRQQYNGFYFAEREEGKTKNISTLLSIENKSL